MFTVVAQRGVHIMIDNPKCDAQQPQIQLRINRIGELGRRFVGSVQMDNTLVVPSKVFPDLFVKMLLERLNGSCVGWWRQWRQLR